jgi:hypothetical protein
MFGLSNGQRRPTDVGTMLGKSYRECGLKGLDGIGSARKYGDRRCEV